MNMDDSKRFRRDINPSFSSSLLDHIYQTMDHYDADDDDPVSTPQKQLFSSNACFQDDAFLKPKPIRTTSIHQHHHDDVDDKIIKHTKSNIHKDEDEAGGKLSTKSKALKKMYTPISPGGRLATLLTSLFSTSGNKNLPNTASSTYYKDTKSKSSSSSASSFSRSFLLTNIHASSSKPKLHINKRSVTFYPVDKHSQTYEHESLEKNLKSIKFSQSKVKVKSRDENRHISEAARNLLKKYQKKVERATRDDEFDDGASDSSSDLFELDNLSAIGMHRYREELPVYETTQLHTNTLLI